ncbi:MAG: YbgC/FadM family acyl-CoA thioesterase [Alphaproteobacteria bacterium]|nr:YbgC/FadM family acyl-CoA thioesterase [Alphaproteobacteria bacterium]MBV8548198.1 YbgC/FadM family acyl-CoA thioesterase [Alphaproteobacteria bacterium]
MPIQVYYEDTDAGGIVYHANFLKFAERARTSWLHAIGWPPRRVQEDLHIQFVVKHIEIDYRNPGFLDDKITATCTLENIGNSSITFEQLIERDKTVLAALKVVCVTINAKGRPIRVPPQLRQIFGA